jgi:hypothetical protein
MKTVFEQRSVLVPVEMPGDNEGEWPPFTEAQVRKEAAELGNHVIDIGRLRCMLTAFASKLHWLETSKPGVTCQACGTAHLHVSCCSALSRPEARCPATGSTFSRPDLHCDLPFGHAGSHTHCPATGERVIWSKTGV